MPCRTHFSDVWMQRSIISNEKVSYLYFGILPENRWMSFLHSTSHYSLSKSLKDLSDHLNFFVSCQGRSQLSPAIFRASRNHLVASKHSYMLQLSKTAINGQSVQVNMAYDLIYMYLFCGRPCRRSVDGADVNFFQKALENLKRLWCPLSLFPLH